MIVEVDIRLFGACVELQRSMRLKCMAHLRLTEYGILFYLEKGASLNIHYLYCHLRNRAAWLN
jgi:hypothetical protein